MQVAEDHVLDAFLHEALAVRDRFVGLLPVEQVQSTEMSCAPRLQSAFSSARSWPRFSRFE